MLLGQVSLRWSAVGLGQLEVECCWDGSEWSEWELSTIETQTGIKVQIKSQHVFFFFFVLFFSFWFFFFLDDISRININSTL